MDIGQIIKQLRTDKDWTQEELSKYSGISRVAIGNYERGSRNPNIKILTKLANALDVSPNVFLDSTIMEEYKEEKLNDELQRELASVVAENKRLQNEIAKIRNERIELEEEILELIWGKDK